MFELGYEEYFYGKGVSIIEWADQIEELLPEESIRIYLEYGKPRRKRYTCIF